MASISRLARALNSGHAIAKTLNPHRLSPSPPRIPLPIPLYINRYPEQNKQTVGSCGSKTTRELTVPTILPGLHGFGLVDFAYAYSTKASNSAKTSFLDLDETARREQLRLESLLRSKGVRRGSYPPFTVVVVEGQKLGINFKVPLSFATDGLIPTLMSRISTPDRVLYIVGMVCPHFLGRAEIELMMDGGFTSEELDAVVTALQQLPRRGGLEGMFMKWIEFFY